jgi:hypothetical protein
MELFLNLAWLGLSVALVWGYFAFAHSAPNKRKWLAVVALALLIFVLLPAISMTDDLSAINNPGETDHIFRRDGTPLPLHTDIAVVAIVPLLLGIFAIGIACVSGEQFKLRSLLNVLLDGALRSLGLRPPPPFSSPRAA